MLPTWATGLSQSALTMNTIIEHDLYLLSVRSLLTFVIDFDDDWPTPNAILLVTGVQALPPCFLLVMQRPYV